MSYRTLQDEDVQLNWREIYLKFQEDMFGMDFDPEPVSQEELNQLWFQEYNQAEKC